MHKRIRPGAWRTAVAAGALAVITAGSATAAQPFAVDGQPMEVRTDTVSGRTATAALYGIVTELVPGEGSRFGGQGAYGDWLATGGSFEFSRADGSAAGRVHVSIMDESMFPGYAVDCESDWMESCELSERGDGSRLLTYATSSGGIRSFVAELYVEGHRVTAQATNATGPRDHPVVAGKDPVLTREQVVTIATQPWWSLEGPLDAPSLPDLPSYDEAVPTIVG